MKINKKLEAEVLVVIALFLFIFLISLDSVILISPSDVSSIIERNPNLEWKGNYNYYDLVISKNADLSDPIVSTRVYGNNYFVKNKLDFGEYYWKIIGYKEKKVAESVIKKISIVSLVALTDFRNTGNTQLSVNFRNDYGITGAMILGINEQLKEIPENSLITAEQNEK